MVVEKRRRKINQGEKENEERRRKWTELGMKRREEEVTEMRRE